MTSETLGNVLIVRMDATYSALEAGLLESAQKRLVELVQDSIEGRVVLDFTDTTFFSTAFFELLENVKKAVEEREGRLVLCCLRPMLLDIFQRAKVDRIWTIAPTQEKAVELAYQ